MTTGRDVLAGTAADLPATQDDLANRSDGQDLIPEPTPSAPMPARREPIYRPDWSGPLGNELMDEVSLSPQQVSEVSNAYSQILEQDGFGKELAGAVGAWARTVYASPSAPREKQQHGYDLRNFEDVIAPADMPYVHSFCNMMAKRGEDVSAVARMLDLYVNVNREMEKQLRAQAASGVPSEAASRAENEAGRSAVIAAVHERYGAEYTKQLDRVRTYIASLPADMREQIEGQDERGLMWLNVPENFLRLVELANENVLPQGAVADQELAKIEEVMRTDRHRYNRDETMQARYRALIARRLA